MFQHQKLIIERTHDTLVLDTCKPWRCHYQRKAKLLEGEVIKILIQNRDPDRPRGSSQDTLKGRRMVHVQFGAIL